MNCNGLGRRYNRWVITRNSRYGGSNCPYNNGYTIYHQAWVHSCTCCAVLGRWRQQRRQHVCFLMTPITVLN